MRGLKLLSGLAAAAASATAAGMVLAQDAVGALPIIGRPHDAGIGFQPAATELADDIHFLDGMINWIIGGITLLVMLLLLIVAVRYNSRMNKTPARFTHNTPIEVTWTLVPIIILVFIGAFSLPILFKQQEIPAGEITIKVTGNQWFWHYDYVDDGFGFDAYMIGQPATIDDKAEPDVVPYVLTDAMAKKLEAAGYSKDEFLLAADNAVVVPVGKIVVMQVTAADVIHSWALPAFGVKQDGIPGRIAHLWFKAEREGIYFGQCSELCGKDHAYMPITVKVVSEAAYAEWLAKAKQEFASLDGGAPAPVRLASN
jgi:cytochrome c oxidase subunit 2